MEEEAKKERPQNRNLRPLGSDKSNPERDAEIHRQGQLGQARARSRNKALTDIVRAVAFLGSQDSKTKKGNKKAPVDIDTLKTVSDIDEKSVPQIVLVIQAQFIKAQKGDVEARDWICKMLGVDPKDLPVFPHLEGDAQPGGATPGSGDSVARYHLIRGEKPIDEENPADDGGEATRAINEAMAALEAAASGSTPDGEGGPDG